LVGALVEVGVGPELEVGVALDPPPLDGVPEMKLAIAGPGKTYLALLSKTVGSKMPGSLSL
jgi:hypothetical protein